MTTINSSVHRTDHRTLSIEIVRFTRFITVEFRGSLLKSESKADFKFCAYVNPTADQNLDEIQDDLFVQFPNAGFYDARESEVAQ